MMRNVLITSAGRRVELVRAFQEQLRLLIPGGRVFATDNQPDLSAACQIADATGKMPQQTDPAYPEFLLRFCQTHKIGLVIPTIDTGLIMFAAIRNRFQNAGIHVTVPSRALVALCRDKRETGRIFADHGIRYPEIYPPDQLKFPCFTKPVSGSATKDAYVIPAPNALPPSLLTNPNMLFMEYLDARYVEYTVDAYYNKSGDLRCLVPRRRIAVRAGEICKGITHKGELYRFLVDRFSHIEGAAGCLTMQFFVREDGRDCVGIEINPRFGGGYPLSHAAGANFAGWMIKEYLFGDAIPFFDSWEPDLMMLRHDTMVLLRKA